MATQIFLQKILAVGYKMSETVSLGIDLRFSVSLAHNDQLNVNIRLCALCTEQL
jgi:hypothetical protein